MIVRRRLECTTPASSAALTTAARARAVVPGDMLPDDATLLRYIENASDILARSIGLPAADGEVQPLAKQTYREEIRTTGRHGFCLHLSRGFVRELTSVTQDGATLDLASLWLAKTAGRIERNDEQSFGEIVVVEYTAGFVTPVSETTEEPSDLPPALEDAVLRFMALTRAAAGDDAFEPPLKSDSIPGVGSVTYAIADQPSAESLPEGIRRALNPFMRHVLA